MGKRGFGDLSKISIGNLCKPFRNVILFRCQLSPEAMKVWMRKSKFQKLKCLKKQKMVLGEIKVFFILLKGFFK